MVKSRQPQPPRAADLTPEAMRAGITKLDRRIDELKSFDVNTIRERWDPVMKALAMKVNGTLQEILGHDTVEYREYSVHSFDTLPVMRGGGAPLPQVIEGYRRGIERTVLQLNGAEGTPCGTAERRPSDGKYILRSPVALYCEA